MNPETIEKLLAYPETQELLDYLRKEAKELDSVRDIPDGHPYSVALESQARRKAFDKISKILLPLVDVRKPHSLPNPEEYVA